MAASLVHQVLAEANSVIQNANIPLLLLGAAAITVLWRAAVIVYNLSLHPLAKIPGPKLQAAIDFPFMWQSYVAGNGVYKTAVLHKQHGAVVRVGPNRIIVDGAIAWPEIYANGSKATEFPKPKHTFFPDDHLSLINAPKERHREMRRQLAHAFSDSALTQQEETIVRYVNLLMQRLDELEAKNATFNITEWLNYMTFDLIGELAFSESFHSLEQRRYHPWVLSIFQGIRGGAFRRFSKNYPLINFIWEKLGLSQDIKVGDRNRTAARRRADKRMQLGESIEGGKMDFMTYMMRKTRNGDPGMNAQEILATSPVLVVAGSETTATTLSGLLFFLSRNPDKAEILINELRGAYKSEEDISMRNTAALQYLHAAIEETLRLYPAAAFTTARLSPGGEVGGYYLPKGVSIYVNAWATFQNPKHFHRSTEFLPERWLPASHPLHSDAFSNDNRDAFKPFSHGTRNCIGKNLAYAEMRLLVSRILFRYEVEIPGQEDWKTRQRCFGIWEKGPLMVKLDKRHEAPIVPV